jgi:hypothetical protein
MEMAPLQQLIQVEVVQAMPLALALLPELLGPLQEGITSSHHTIRPSQHQEVQVTVSHSPKAQATFSETRLLAPLL